MLSTCSNIRKTVRDTAKFGQILPMFDPSVKIMGGVGLQIHITVHSTQQYRYNNEIRPKAKQESNS